MKWLRGRKKLPRCTEGVTELGKMPEDEFSGRMTLLLTR